MSESTYQSPREERVNAVLANYLRATQRGKEPAREDLLARHPDLADELTAFLDDRDAVLRVTAPLLAASQDPTLPPPGDGCHDSPGSFGDYEHLEEIARGAFGVVYRAHQVSANRPVALKMILAGRFASDGEVRRFRREAEMAARLDHPNIVPVYEVGTHDGRPFFSMKLVEGGTLSGQLGRFPGDPAAAARMVARIARAVHHAHQRGLLHRDLKPANVLLSHAKGGEPVPLVTDFGLGRWIEADGGLTQSGAILGTLEYMAPEQACGRRGLTTAVDVYGLGAILYALLTGRPPYRAETVLETLRQVVDAEPPRPSALSPGVPRDLEVICRKCLAKDTAGRYGSAEALAEDLERWLSGEPIAARPAGRLERLRLWARRSPVVAALTAGVAALAIALTAVAVGAAVHFAGLNAELVHETAEAKAARQEEGRQRQAAAASADLAQQRLGRMYAENGIRALEQDPAAALLWFAEALRWDGDNPRRAELHRTRVNAFLEGWPLPERDFPLPPYRGHNLEVSPDGNFVAVFHRPLPARAAQPRSHEQAVDSHVVDLRTGRVVVDGSAARLSQPDTGRDSARPLVPRWFSSDGRRFVGMRGGKVHVWDLESGRTLTPPLDRPVVLSPEGRWLLAVSGGRARPLVAGYELATGRRAWELEAEVARGTSAFASPYDGRFVARDRDGRWRAYQAATGRPWDRASPRPPGRMPTCWATAGLCGSVKKEGRTACTTRSRASGSFPPRRRSRDRGCCSRRRCGPTSWRTAMAHASPASRPRRWRRSLKGRRRWPRPSRRRPWHRRPAPPSRAVCTTPPPANPRGRPSCGRSGWRSRAGTPTGG